MNEKKLKSIAVKAIEERQKSPNSPPNDIKQGIFDAYQDVHDNNNSLLWKMGAPVYCDFPPHIEKRIAEDNFDYLLSLLFGYRGLALLLFGSCTISQDLLKILNEQNKGKEESIALHATMLKDYQKKYQEWLDERQRHLDVQKKLDCRSKAPIEGKKKAAAARCENLKPYFLSIRNKPSNASVKEAMGDAFDRAKADGHAKDHDNFRIAYYRWLKKDNGKVENRNL